MKQKFFYDNMKGLNADIDRHRGMEKELLIKIENCEKDGSETFIHAYHNLLKALRCSKANIVDMIGKK